MSSLPEWIKEMSHMNSCDYSEINELLEALAIAVEALKKSSQQKFGWKIAKRALRRIEELGK